jgi:hypothetical protein
MNLADLSAPLVAIGTIVIAYFTWQMLAHQRRAHFLANLPRLQFKGTALLLIHIWPSENPDPHEGATQYLRLTGVLRNSGAAPASDVTVAVTSGSDLGELSLPPLSPGEELRLDGSEASKVFVKPTHPRTALGPIKMSFLYFNPAGERFETVYTSLEDERFRDEATGPARREPQRH